MSIHNEAMKPKTSGLRTALRHALCILALMWTPLVNGQPFYFLSDTTNYVRAADAAVYAATGGRFSTVWTNRYKDQLAHGSSAPVQTQPKQVPAERKPRPQVGGVNDLGKGMIMSGRSPYIGALMYLGYVGGKFWPFVLLQACIAYALIILTLRRFKVATPVNVTGLTLALAATTALPTYNGLLLADAFASFGMIAFLLIASPGRLSRGELIFLALVLVTSVTAHLTHITIILGMTVALALATLRRWVPKPPRRAWVAGIGAVVIGLASVQLTDTVTKRVFGHPPQLLPLLSARFIADGPGKNYIDAGCPGGDFVICHIPIGAPNSDAAILFSINPKTGAYMLRNAEERRVMGEQDTRFAWAVLKYDPAGELAMMARNTIQQLFWIDYDGLNQPTWAKASRWASLPPQIRDELGASPSGRRLWPQKAMNVLLYTVVIASLIFLAVSAREISKRSPRRWRLLRQWLILVFAGMLTCAFFGGAVADPQYRYQGRLIWLVPLMAGIALLIRMQLQRGSQPLSIPVESSVATSSAT
jgi:hypothetical protein